MRAVHTLLAGAACAVGAVLAAAPLAHAQVRPAIEGGGSPAAGEELKHGNRVAVTLKDGKKVLGTYVRGTDGTMYVRTQPRAAPTAVRNEDVTKVERISAAGGGRAEGASGPEIHKVTIYNGPEMSVRYIAPNLSPGEQSQLTQLESAENEYNRVSRLSSLTQEYLQDEQNLEKYRYEAERNYYRFSALGAMGFYPGTALTAWPNYGYVNFAGSPYYASMALYSGSGYVSGQYVPGGFGAVPVAPGYFNGSSYPPPPNLAMGDEGVIKTTLAQNLARDLKPEALSQARHNLEAARSHAVFDGDNIVAVSMDEPEYKKGDRVVVTPKDGRPINGTVVSSSPDRLVIRTQPNAAPIMLRLSNIEAIEPQAVKGAGAQ